MSEEKLIILIFVEVTFILTIALTLLVLHNKRLKKALAQDTEMDSNESSSNEEGGDSWPPEKFLTEELKATNAEYFTLTGSMIPNEANPLLTDTNNEKLLAMLLRYYYLHAELTVLKIRQNHDVFWSSLTPLLLRLIPLLPSTQGAQNELSEQKIQLETLKKHSSELELSQKILFMIQNLFRSKLPKQYIEHFLPLTDEIELLKKEQGFETIQSNYARLFDQLHAALALHQTKAGQESDETSSEQTTPVADGTTSEYQVLSQKLSEVLNFAREKKNLDDTHLSELHNTIIKLNNVFKTQEKSLASLLFNFNESQMCNSFLESELAAAQEATRALLETIEEGKRQENPPAADEAMQI